MANPSFLNLMSNYPKVNEPCDQPWGNQCAIRMSVTLNAEGTLTVNKNTYKDPVCNHGHARGAESLANWLWKKLGRPQIFKEAAKANQKIGQSTGIIFFKDCFVRDGETEQNGDHIDLWDHGTTKTSNMLYESKQIWFWELK